VTRVGGPWFEPWHHAAALGRGALAAFAHLWDPGQLQRQWFAHLSQNMDAYLRSPAFLELMAHNLRAMTPVDLIFPFSIPYRRISR
jgi:hypothetical protein